MRSWIPLFVVYLVTGCSARTPIAAVGDRQQEIAAQRATSEEALASYRPKAAKLLSDLTADAAPVLRQLPGVADVQTLVRAEGQPTHRVVQLRDWHWVPRDLFAADVRSANKGQLSDAEIEAAYAQHVEDVELVQIEQLTLLRCLVRYHGLKQVLAEGLTPTGVENYGGVIAAFRATDDRLKALQGQIATLRNKPESMQRELEQHIRDFRRSLLEFGAAAQLALAGRNPGRAAR